MQTAHMLDLSMDTEQVSPTDHRFGLISIDPERMSGVPCFAGTRVPVQYLWDYLAAGESLDVFLDCYPTVSREIVVNTLHLAGQKLLEGLPVR